MQYDVPENFHELCARALKENVLETVEEIVDRILCAANENSKVYPEYRNRNGQDL